MAAWYLFNALTTLSFVALGVALLFAIVVFYKERAGKMLALHIVLVVIFAVITKFTFFLGTSL